MCRWGCTHVGFVVTGLKDELLGVMLPVLHRSGRGGLVGWTQRDWLAPLACLKQQPIARQDSKKQITRRGKTSKLVLTQLVGLINMCGLSLCVSSYRSSFPDWTWARLHVQDEIKMEWINLGIGTVPILKLSWPRFHLNTTQYNKSANFSYWWLKNNLFYGLWFF